MTDARDTLLDQIASLAARADRRFVAAHVESLPQRYVRDYSIEDIAAHADELCRLSGPADFRVLWEVEGTGLLSITLLAYDYPAEFSIFTGLLAAMNFDIKAGHIYTYARDTRSDESPARSQRRRLRRGWYLRDTATSQTPTRKIVDTFHGRTPGDIDPEVWVSKLRETLAEFFALLAENDPESLSEAKRRLIEEVTAALPSAPFVASTMLYPIELSVETDAEYTRMTIVSQDTPFFLYSLSMALAVHDLSIEHVEIRTIGERVEDEFYLTDSHGSPITDQHTLNQLKLSALVTKQFTFFLEQAPDPRAAIVRFEQMVQDLLEGTGEKELVSLLQRPDAMKDLARLLGASDFLWEDFIRLQYESILPMVAQSHVESLHPEEIWNALQSELAPATTVEERIGVLNRFKDHHTYLIDLEHILNPSTDFFFLSTRLSAMAEAVVAAAIQIRFDELHARYGVPRTVAGIEVPYAVLGLGKLGGAALGYASDLELMFVYSDNGATDGEESISNAEFFDRLFQLAASTIESKREGIYQVDLRLRPHGSAGSFATSLGTFVRYYSSEAMSFEKLALVRLRAIAGDKEFGARVERIRDQLVYQADAIDLKELRELRTRQLEEKAGDGRLNAKFSPGGLVDLEYSVQILQILHGRTNAELRTPRIHAALDALVAAGTVNRDEAQRLVRAYRFSRRLINGLRMLRGNAKDLFLPSVDSPEYLHLARRMGYRDREGLTPAQQLHMEFESTSASVRTFVERHLGRDALPGNPVGTVADLVLAPDAENELSEEICAAAGLRNCRRAHANVQRLIQSASRDTSVAELLILAWDVLRRTADPDMALNNWERLVASLPEAGGHFERLVAQPKRVEILLHVMAGSQFLADTLIRNPDFFDWVIDPSLVNTVRTEDDYSRELRSFLGTPSTDPLSSLNTYMDDLRRYRTREILRIGTRDVALRKPIREVVRELSNLARAVVHDALHQAMRTVDSSAVHELDRLCVLAFGKLGGAELNYSSDIDLLAVYQADGASDYDVRLFSRVIEQLRSILSKRTQAGYVYRVDLRLRPHGSAGPIVTTVDSALTYYRNAARLWEHQALLKLSPIAGNRDIGVAFLRELDAVVRRRRSGAEIRESINDLRNAAISMADDSHLGSSELDIKTGTGGIRDIEFLVQGLQLAWCPDEPSVLSGNTLDAIRRLERVGALGREAAVELSDDYIELRRAEHLLQLFDDRQVHRLPADPRALDAFARRALGAKVTGEEFSRHLAGLRSRVRARYEALLPR